LEAELAHPRADPSEALTLALGDVNRLETTIDQLLTLARDTGGARDPVDLVTTLEGLARRWGGPLALRGREMHLTIPSAVPRPTVSAAALTHILDVLVDNALRHGAGTVDVVARPVDGAAVAIDVQDEGPGVADPIGAFQRRNATAEGTGIGLSLARRLAEAEGGRLRLVGRRPTSRFELMLPVARPEPSAG
jgi:signal transduction histidine kinase